MEPYKEALRAKEHAEKRFSKRDYVGAKDYAMKAQMIYPSLEGIPQMLTSFGVYLASEIKVNGEPDCYSVLGLDPSAGKVKVKKRFRKLSGLLHPDKNKTVGADGAFKIISEAWLLLSDAKRRRMFDRKRKKQMSLAAVQGTLSLGYSGGVTGFEKPPASHGLDTFWTVCTSCQVQYEYLRKYLNKKLSCKNCRGVFVALETGRGPVNGAFPYSNWSNMPANGYGNHGHKGVTYAQSNELYFTENRASGYHSGHSSEYVSNVSFQWGSVPGASAVNNIGLSCTKAKVRGKRNKNGFTNNIANVLIGYSEPSASKGVRGKKRKLERGSRTGLVPGITSEPISVNGQGNTVLVPKPEAQSETLARRYSSVPPFDVRCLLLERARTEIRKKLEETNVSLGELPGIGSEKRDKVHGGDLKAGTIRKRNLSRLELKRTDSMPITVPDSDFHDFDKDRSEECFKPKQIWAIYDEEDGMPRLYCLIREVMCVKPFKIQISYLNSKTDTEFGPVNWVVFGFTKSCGSFRAFNSDVVEEVNLFSHLLEREKAGRGGCVRIYPRCGDIWAVYQNWSPDWNRNTPKEVRHQYEMVEVLDDYSEEQGLCVAPLVKRDGYKTVYQRIGNKAAIRWIQRREMIRFSHQVPSWPLKGDGVNFLDGCWDLDPAATPNVLLHVSRETKIKGNPDDLLQISSERKIEENPDELLPVSGEMKIEDKVDEVLQVSTEMTIEDKPCEAEN